MDKTENAELQLLWAECAYTYALSFHAMTGPKWTYFFSKIRPGFKLPTRDQVANELLDKSFERVTKLAEEHIDKCDYISLVIDGWTNVRKDAIINIVAMTPKAVFLKSIDTKGATKDADYMLEVIEELITERNVRKINALISDNEPKMECLARCIQAKYSHIVFSGCVAHKLNNLIKKMCALDVIKELVDGTKEIIKEINDHQKLHAKFRDMIKADKDRKFGELKLFCETRFAGTVLMIQSVIKAIVPLRSIAGDPENSVVDSVKERVLGSKNHKDFIAKLTQFQKLVKPICDCIHHIESDCCSLADMIEYIQTTNGFKDPLNSIF